MSAADNSNQATLSPRQVILGLFVLGQLLFLVLSNLLGLFHDSQKRLDIKIATVIDRVLPGYSAQAGHAWKNTDELSTPLRRWAQFTGQDQSWSLFAPGVWKVTGFPALVLSWDDEPISASAIARGLTLFGARDGLEAAATAAVLQLRPDELQPPAYRVAAPALTWLAATNPLEKAACELAASCAAAPIGPKTEQFLSDNEPLDVHHFFRVGMFRLRRYESGLIIYLTKGEEESEADARDRWSREIRNHVSENADQLQAFVKWRLSVYQQRHPEKPPPRQVILIERVYKMLPPGDQSGAVWTRPTSLPLVRWQPAYAGNDFHRALEQFDPVSQGFESVRK